MQSAVDVWQLFKANFLKLWDEQGSQGDAYPEQLFGQSAPQGRAATKVRLLLLPFLTSSSVYASQSSCAWNQLVGMGLPYSQRRCVASQCGQRNEDRHSHRPGLVFSVIALSAN